LKFISFSFLWNKKYKLTKHLWENWIMSLLMLVGIWQWRLLKERLIISPVQGLSAACWFPLKSSRSLSRVKWLAVICSSTSRSIFIAFHNSAITDTWLWKVELWYEILHIVCAKTMHWSISVLVAFAVYRYIHYDAHMTFIVELPVGFPASLSNCICVVADNPL